MPSGQAAIAAPTAASTDSGFVREDLLEPRERGSPVAFVDQLLSLAQRICLGVTPHGEAELERRGRALGFRRRGGRALVPALQDGGADDQRGGAGRRQADQGAGTAWRHAASVAPWPLPDAAGR